MSGFSRLRITHGIVQNHLGHYLRPNGQLDMAYRPWQLDLPNGFHFACPSGLDCEAAALISSHSAAHSAS
jgi:hypothetical protein